MKRWIDCYTYIYFVWQKRYYYQGLAALDTIFQSGVVRTTGGEKVRHYEGLLRMRKEIGTGTDLM